MNVCTVHSEDIFYDRIKVFIKSRGQGFTPATMSVAPGYFYWKIK